MSQHADLNSPEPQLSRRVSRPNPQEPGGAEAERGRVWTESSGGAQVHLRIDAKKGKREGTLQASVWALHICNLRDAQSPEPPCLSSLHTPCSRRASPGQADLTPE